MRIKAFDKNGLKKSELLEMFHKLLSVTQTEEEKMKCDEELPTDGIKQGQIGDENKNLQLAVRVPRIKAKKFGKTKT